MMNRYRQIDLSDWIQAGEGATAKTYNKKNDESIMLKMFNADGYHPEQNKFAYCEDEMAKTKQLLALGLSVPDALEIVEAEGFSGIIYERVVDKKSLSRIIADEPERLEEVIRLFAGETKRLHAIPCSAAAFTDIKALYIKTLEDADYLPEDVRLEGLKRLRELPDENTCLHGDLNTGNMIVAGGKPYWIDLGDFGYGSPWLDIAGLYFLMMTYDGYKKNLFPYPPEYNERIWNCFIREYLGTDEPEEIKAAEKTAKYYEFVFLLRQCIEGHSRVRTLEQLGESITGLIRLGIMPQ